MEKAEWGLRKANGSSTAWFLLASWGLWVVAKRYGIEIPWEGVLGTGAVFGVKEAASKLKPSA